MNRCFVAQVGNLLFRRLAVGWAAEDRQGGGFPIRDTADSQSALRFRGSMREIPFGRILSSMERDRVRGNAAHELPYNLKTQGNAELCDSTARTRRTIHKSEIRRCRPLLGTFVEITTSGLGESELARSMDTAFAAIERIHRLMSVHEETSELSGVNRDATSRPVPISRETFTVLRRALQISAESDGAFDCTVAPVLARWGILPAHLRRKKPGTWRDVQLLPGNRVQFVRPLALDFGGIAKGFAVDAAIESLRRNGVANAVVNAGGDVRAFGPCASVVHVRHPASSQRAMGSARASRAAFRALAEYRRASELAQPSAMANAQRWTGEGAGPNTRGHVCSPGRTESFPQVFAHRIELHNSALATSSPCFTERDFNGRRVSHLVRSTEGGAITGPISVSVRASKCWLADALTKVVLNLPQRAQRLLAKYDAEAFVLSA